jgi:hypothetical protein
MMEVIFLSTKDGEALNTLYQFTESTHGTLEKI